MKRRYLIWGVLIALSLSLFCLAFVGCDKEKEKEKDPAPEIKETITFSEKTNPFAELTWQQYIDNYTTDEQSGADYWKEKMASKDIYYQFEGSYSEAYQGNYSRTFLYLNCYNDGSLHATYGRENYYGFWTNLDRRGNPSLVLHFVRYNDKEYNNGIYESVCDDYVHTYYEYSSTVIWNQWGTRTVLIYGGHYSPVKSLAVKGGQTKYRVGDKFSSKGLTVTVTRENGKSIDIDEQSFPQSDCRVKFTGYDVKKEGKQTVTVSYVYSDVTTTFDVETVGAKSLSLDAAEVQKEYHVGDKLNTAGMKLTATYKDDTQADITPADCEITGFDSSAAAESQTVTVDFYGLQKTFDVKIIAPVYTGDNVSIKVVSPTACDVTFSGKTARLGYTTMNAAGKTVYNLTRPEGDTSLTDAEWAAMQKQYVFDRETLTAAALSVYEIPSDGFGDGSVRAEQEPMPGIGGNTEKRYILIDDKAKTATITYKYWNGSNTDTFVCKYTLSGDLLTLTDCVDAKVGGSNAKYANLYKTWTLGDDYKALKHAG